MAKIRLLNSGGFKVLDNSVFPIVVEGKEYYSSTGSLIGFTVERDRLTGLAFDFSGDGGSCYFSLVGGECEIVKESDWISVKDRLPSEGVYLFATKTKDVQVGFMSAYSSKYKKPEAAINGKGRQFTHWMPLPAPPVTK